MKDEIKKINVNGLELSIDNKETGRGREIGLFVRYPEFLTLDFYKNNHKLIDTIFWHTAHEFHLSQLKNADALMDRLESLGLKELYDWSENIYEYEGKTALMDAYIYKGKLEPFDIRPYVRIDSGRFEAFTIMPGNFADYSAFPSHGERMFGTTKDFNTPGAILVSIFMIDLMENIEKFILKNEELVVVADCQHLGRELLKPIQEEIIESAEKLVVKNKSKRIDMLRIDNETMLDKVRKNNTSKYFISSQTIFNMAILYGKPFKQVEEFLKKAI